MMDYILQGSFSNFRSPEMGTWDGFLSGLPHHIFLGMNIHVQDYKILGQFPRQTLPLDRTAMLLCV